MSRWSDKFDKHAIHETIRQIQDWVSTEFEEIDSNHETERRRLRKVLDFISYTVEGMDNEFFPEEELNQLNGHMRHQSFWNQLNAYASNGGVPHLVTANNHMDSQVPRIFQMARQARSPESQKAIRGVEEAFEKFCKSVETTNDNFNAKIQANDSNIDFLNQRASDLEAAQKILSNETETAFNEWSKEHTDAQNVRSTEFSNGEIKRNKSFEKSQKSISDKAEAEHKQVFAELSEKNQAAQKEFGLQVRNITADINAKHQSILRVHDLVAGDGVAGGYKKTSKDEAAVADQWRIVAMISFGVAAVWTLIKVVVYWSGLASVEQFDWAEVLAATSLTLILLATAAYAAAQSKFHRMNEQQMSWFSLEVGALDPFIASLTEDQQRVLKIQLSQRLFGQNSTVNASGVEAGEDGIVKTLLDAITEIGKKP